MEKRQESAADAGGRESHIWRGSKVQGDRESREQAIASDLSVEFPKRLMQRPGNSGGNRGRASGGKEETDQVDHVQLVQPPFPVSMRDSHNECLHDRRSTIQ
jgi:hypothetical protein